MSDPGQIIELAQAKQGRAMHQWIARLARTEQGATHPTLSNALILFANDPQLVGLLGYNEFTSEHLIMRPAPAAEDGGATLPGPYPRMWGPEDLALTQGYFQRLWSHKFNRQTVEDAMVAAAALNRFHPVRDWLDSLVWDGKPRIDTWLHIAFGAPEDEYHEAVGAKFLIAAVRRVRQPGCKFDHVPVLEGLQDLGKSTTCRNLFGDEYFSDSLPHDLANRDAAMGLLGKWGIELGEIDHLIRNEVETVKAFLSRGTDRFRAPYGKTFREYPRQGVLIGTTNQDDYLRDATGNRRFWPIRCTKAEPAWVAEVRDHLWAEASLREKTGEPIWLEDDVIRRKAQVQQSGRLLEDVWTHKVLTFLEDRTGHVYVWDILHNAIGLPVDRQDRKQEMRAADILRKCGWVKHDFWNSARRRKDRAWFGPGMTLIGTDRIVASIPTSGEEMP